MFDVFKVSRFLLLVNVFFFFFSALYINHCLPTHSAAASGYL
jgi:hypothetical protein